MAVAFRFAGSPDDSAGTSITLSISSSIQIDNVLIAFIVDRSLSASSPAPTGWTRQGGIASGGRRFQVFTAIVGKNGLTGTSWTWTDLTANIIGRIFAYSGVDTTTPLNTTVSARINGIGTHGTASVNTTLINTMVVAAFCFWTTTATYDEAVTDPGALAERGDQTSLVTSLAVADGLKASIGATGASTADPVTDGTNAGILFALKKWLTYPIYLTTGSYVLQGNAIGLRHIPKDKIAHISVDDRSLGIESDGRIVYVTKEDKHLGIESDGRICEVEER